jgi:hypothetical protein
LASYDLTRSALKGDWGGVAEGAGGLTGGFVAGKYGQRAFAPQVGSELGFIRIRTQADVLSSTPGLDNLPGSQAANFNSAHPISIGDAPLYRVFDNLDMQTRDGAKPNGGYWSQAPYSNEGAWRSGAAVQEGWNAGTYLGIWTPTRQPAWGGTAAPQALEGFSAKKWGFEFGWINKGGDYQVYVPNSRSVIHAPDVAVQPSLWKKP